MAVRRLCAFGLVALVAGVRDEETMTISELTNESTKSKIPGRFPADILGGLTCNNGQTSAVMRTSCQTLRKDVYRRITSQVADVLADLREKSQDVCTATDCMMGDWAGCVLRLVGHDLMDYDPKTQEGGNDACIDFDDPDNTGLHDCLDGEGEFGLGHSVENMYQEFCNEVSLADYLVIVAEALMVVLRPDFDWTTLSSATLSWGKFKFGRETQPSCSPGRLPDPLDSCHAVQENFIDHLGLNWTGAAALMGVHTLGRAKAENSGYNGWWVSGEDGRKFDNFYYVSLLGAGWVPAEVESSGKYQWIRSDGGPREDIMLNTDICMLWTTDSGCHAESLVDRNCCLWASHIGLQGAESICVDGCRFDTCCRDDATKRCGNIHLMPTGSFPAGQESADAIIDFSKHEDHWLATFKDAWHHTTWNGKHDLFYSDCVDGEDEAP